MDEREQGKRADEITNMIGLASSIAIPAVALIPFWHDWRGPEREISVGIAFVASIGLFFWIKGVIGTYLFAREGEDARPRRRIATGAFAFIMLACIGGAVWLAGEWPWRRDPSLPYTFAGLAALFGAWAAKQWWRENTPIIVRSMLTPEQRSALLEDRPVRLETRHILAKHYRGLSVEEAAALSVKIAAHWYIEASEVRTIHNIRDVSRIEGSVRNLFDRTYPQIIRARGLYALLLADAVLTHNLTGNQSELAFALAHIRDEVQHKTGTPPDIIWQNPDGTEGRRPAI